VVEKPSRHAKGDEFDLEAYKQAATFHNLQETLFWTRNNILVSIQAGLIAAMFLMVTREGASLEQGKLRVLMPLLGLCGVGLLTSVMWTLMVRRSYYVMEQTLEILARIEWRFGSDEIFSVFTDFRRASQTYRDNPEALKPSKFCRDHTDASKMLVMANGAEFTKGSLWKDARAGTYRRLSTLWSWVGWGFVLAWKSGPQKCVLQVRPMMRSRRSTPLRWRGRPRPSQLAAPDSCSRGRSCPRQATKGDELGAAERGVLARPSRAHGQIEAPASTRQSELHWRQRGSGRTSRGLGRFGLGFFDRLRRVPQQGSVKPLELHRRK
jgi:cytochrome c oxidase subunit IV